ncbi:MAG: signal peptide peptidase SppA [Bacteroidota bacterium]
MRKSAQWFLSILALGILGCVLAVLLLMKLASASRGGTELVAEGSGEKVALVELTGVIVSSEEVVRQMKERREDDAIRAIVLRVESPGGGVAASQEMYEEVRKTAEGGTPVVVSMGSIAASGGYYVSCGATRIVANPGTLTGSIGVISEFLQLEEAMSRLGIGVKTVKSGKLKDAGSFTRRMSSEDEEYFRTLMQDVHQQFTEVVERERGLTPERVRTLADGRVFTGREALRVGLVDTLGTLQDAVAIAAQLAGIEGTPSLVRERRRRSFWDSLLGEAGRAMGAIQREWMDRPVLSYRYAGP